MDDYMSRAQIKKYYAEEKLATAKEIAEFTVSFVVSEELVKNYKDHLKHLLQKSMKSGNCSEVARERI